RCHKSRRGHAVGQENGGLVGGWGGLRGQRPRRVSRRRNSQFLQSVMTRHRYAHSQAAGFETPGWVGAFFLQVGVGISAAPQHGRPAFAERYGLGLRQNAVIAPHPPPAGFVRLLRNSDASRNAPKGRKVITHVESAVALWANRPRFLRRDLRAAA